MKAKFKFTVNMIIVAGLALFVSCDGSSSDKTTHSIGESFGGGIVFYVDGTGEHGLIAATADNGFGIVWSNISTALGTTNTTVGSGKVNTDAIINQPGFTTGAAKVCKDYNGGGYNDWYLPSKDELNLLYQQKMVIGGFQDVTYWCSTEYGDIGVGSDTVDIQDFGDGDQSVHVGKDDTTQHFRAIRSF